MTSTPRRERLVQLLGATALMMIAAGGAAASDPAASGSLMTDESLSLEDLLNVQVVSASNSFERLAEAPAVVVVINRETIERRGYHEISEILDDLPGMEVVRAFGDTYLKNYWRGFRNTVGDPYVLLIDGLVFNHLQYNHAETPLVAFPLANVERIEVVYGPASSVYGANATNGVVNIITRKDLGRDHLAETVKISVGGPRRIIAEGNLFWQRGKLRLSLTGRFDQGDLDTSHTEAYEYTKSRYATDPRLWHGFLQDPTLAGPFTSKTKGRALDARIYYGDTELGFSHFVLHSGYGLVYPSDYGQSNGAWVRPETSAHARHAFTWREVLRSTTTVRYRRSGVSNDSYFVDLDAKNATAGFSYWQSVNASALVSQDLEARYADVATLAVGVRYERKVLERGFDSPYGAYVASDDLAAYQFPARPARDIPAEKRLVTGDLGVYAQAKVRPLAAHHLNFGVRNDRNSTYGSAPTLRAGYVGAFGDFGVKALYGQAYQEPPPRTLYFDWSVSGSNSDLEPERSSTTELSVSYTRRNLSAWVNGWDASHRNVIVTVPKDQGGAKNLGNRRVRGLDAHAELWIEPAFARVLKLWTSYSRLLRASEDKIDPATGLLTGTGRIGDLATDKLWFGASAEWRDGWDATMRGRWIGARRPVATNPLGDVPGYVTLDVRLGYQFRGVTAGLSVNNLLDATYFHPGVRDADAGARPGAFSGTSWVGSQGYYNSRLAQAGRQVFLSLRHDL